MPRFSIIIPARDEEKHLGACLDSVARALRRSGRDAEVVVVLNRCTDGTESIATARGARVVREDAKNLAAIRNAGARAACGGILCTIDADSIMSENMIEEVDRALSSGRYIGGGVPVLPDRWSLGLAVSGTILALGLLATGLAGGMYWCYRRDFEAVGGFNEERDVAEDLDFAARLKAHGRKQGKRFTTLWRTRLVTSARKMDRFGDWLVVRLLLRHPVRTWRMLTGRGRDPEFADRYFYEFKR